MILNSKITDTDALDHIERATKVGYQTYVMTYVHYLLKQNKIVFPLHCQCNFKIKFGKLKVILRCRWLEVATMQEHEGQVNLSISPNGEVFLNKHFLTTKTTFRDETIVFCDEEETE